jgi:hypothetical protein
MRNRLPRTDPADHMLSAHVALQTRCSAEKRGLTYAALSFARKLLQMR